VATGFLNIEEIPPALRVLFVMAGDRVFSASGMDTPGIGVSRTSKQLLLQATLKYDDVWYLVIEQNPHKDSVFAELVKKRGYQIAWILAGGSYVRLYEGGALVVYKEPGDTKVKIGTADDLRDIALSFNTSRLMNEDTLSL